MKVYVKGTANSFQIQTVGEIQVNYKFKIPFNLTNTVKRGDPIELRIGTTYIAGNKIILVGKAELLAK